MCFKSLANRLLVQQLFRPDNEQNISYEGKQLIEVMWKTFPPLDVLVTFFKHGQALLIKH